MYERDSVLKDLVTSLCFTGNPPVVNHSLASGLINTRTFLVVHNIVGANLLQKLAHISAKKNPFLLDLHLSISFFEKRQSRPDRHRPTEWSSRGPRGQDTGPLIWTQKSRACVPPEAQHGWRARAQTLLRIAGPTECGFAFEKGRSQFYWKDDDTALR